MEKERFAVLAVDDEADILFALGLAFADFLPDVELIKASSGAEALKVIDGRRVHVVLSDYKMPGMNGLDFLIEARRRDPRLKSILVTAFPSPQLARAAEDQAGTTMVVAKPFDAEHLAGTVQVLLAQLVQGREGPPQAPTKPAGGNPGRHRDGTH